MQWGIVVVNVSVRLFPVMILAGAASVLAGCSAVENFAADQTQVAREGVSSSNPVASVLPPRPCPSIVIRDNEGVRTIYARGEEGNAKAVIYQAVISDVSRECASFGDTFEFRAGVRGRVTPGALAQPGQTVTLNILMTFQDSSETLWQSVRQVPVTLDPTQGSMEFSFIEENGTALLPAGKDEFAYDITVGFAPEGTRR